MICPLIGVLTLLLDLSASHIIRYLNCFIFMYTHIVYTYSKKQFLGTGTGKSQTALIHGWDAPIYELGYLFSAPI